MWCHRICFETLRPRRWRTCRLFRSRTWTKHARRLPAQNATLTRMTRHGGTAMVISIAHWKTWMGPSTKKTQKERNGFSHLQSWPIRKCGSSEADFTFLGQVDFPYRAKFQPGLCRVHTSRSMRAWCEQEPRRSALSWFLTIHVASASQKPSCTSHPIYSYWVGYLRIKPVHPRLKMSCGHLLLVGILVCTAVKSSEHVSLGCPLNRQKVRQSHAHRTDLKSGQSQVDTEAASIWRRAPGFATEK